MAPPVKQPEVKQSDADAQLEQLKAENARLKAELVEAHKPVIVANAPATTPARADLPEKYRGVKRYRVGDAGGYLAGQVYRKGDVVTLVDAVPSRTWTLVEDDKPGTVPTSAPSAPEGRPSEASI